MSLPDGVRIASAGRAPAGGEAAASFGLEDAARTPLGFATAAEQKPERGRPGKSCGGLWRMPLTPCTPTRKPVEMDILPLWVSSYFGLRRRPNGEMGRISAPRSPWPSRSAPPVGSMGRFRPYPESPAAATIGDSRRRPAQRNESVRRLRMKGNGRPKARDQRTRHGGRGGHVGHVGHGGHGGPRSPSKGAPRGHSKTQSKGYRAAGAKGGGRRGPSRAMPRGPVACPMCGMVVPDLGRHIRERHDDPASHPRD